MNRLLEIGFQPVGHWQLVQGEIAPDLRQMSTRRNVLYAFVCEGDVQYIGRTANQTLANALLACQRPSPAQSAKMRTNASIRDSLMQGGKVDILALEDNDLLHYGGFRINLSAGLEEDMIAKIQPAWNLQRPARPRPEEAGKTPASEPVAEPVQEVPRHTIPKNMPLVLQETYWNRGFFNVPVQYAPLFGGDLEKIHILVPHRQLPIVGYISRSANTNGTPRVMGGRELQKWFRRESSLMGKLNVEILSPTSIVLTPMSGG